MVTWHRDELIPTQAAYQLTATARHYKDWEASTARTRAMRADAQRLLTRKARKTAPAVLEELRAAVESGVGKPEDLARLADQLVITRKLAPIGVAR